MLKMHSYVVDFFLPKAVPFHTSLYGVGFILSKGNVMGTYIFVFVF